MTDKRIWDEAVIGLRDLPPQDEPETVADFVAAFLVLILMVFAFYAAALVVASYGWMR